MLISICIIVFVCLLCLINTNQIPISLCIGNMAIKIYYTKSVYSIFTRSHKDAKKRLNLTVNGSSLSREDNPTYLGVTLDRQLTLNQHMENIRKKADKRLNLVKHLASSNLGADKNTLRCFYLGYTRSIMDYNIVLQNMCSKTNKQSLDRV